MYELFLLIFFVNSFNQTSNSGYIRHINDAVLFHSLKIKMSKVIIKMTKSLIHFLCLFLCKVLFFHNHIKKEAWSIDIPPFRNRQAPYRRICKSTPKLGAKLGLFGK